MMKGTGLSPARLRRLEEDFKRYTRLNPVYVDPMERKNGYTFHARESFSKKTMSEFDNLLPQARALLVEYDSI